jgi:hypothetical protein
MKLLAVVDVGTPSQRAADFVFIDLTPDLAAWLVDQYHLFQQMLQLPGPRPLWVTFVDEHALWYANNGLLPCFELYREELTRDGFVVLPPHFVPEGPAFAAALIPSVKGHMNIAEEGISWHVLMRGSCHHATPPLSEALLKQAAGVKLAAVPPPSPTGSDHG